MYVFYVTFSFHKNEEKSFINEDFSERFLFRQLMKQQLILVLHGLFYCNRKSTL